MPTPIDPQPGPAHVWPEDRPRLLAVLPLVHMAWADGVLTRGERRVLRETIVRGGALDEDDLAALAPWLDAAAPPPPEALAQLRGRIRSGAPPEAADAVSLTELGLELARSAGVQGAWRPPRARSALAAAESTLGLAWRDAVRALLGLDRGSW